MHKNTLILSGKIQICNFYLKCWKCCKMRHFVLFSNTMRWSFPWLLFSSVAVFAFFNRPQVRFPLCQLHLMTLSVLLLLRSSFGKETLASLSLCYSLSFSHFSPLNFFHYVFVKKAERSKEKSGVFFPLVELTPWHERYVSKGRKRRVNFWL